MKWILETGLLATLTPKKLEKEADKRGLATKETIDPIVAFSRPPPLPPFLGPLVALSLLETWWNRGTDEDGKWWCDEIVWSLLEESFGNKNHNSDYRVEQSNKEAP